MWFDYSATPRNQSGRTCKQRLVQDASIPSPHSAGGCASLHVLRGRVLFWAWHLWMHQPYQDSTWLCCGIYDCWYKWVITFAKKRQMLVAGYNSQKIHWTVVVGLFLLFSSSFCQRFILVFANFLFFVSCLYCTPNFEDYLERMFFFSTAQWRVGIAAPCRY